MNFDCACFPHDNSKLGRRQGLESAVTDGSDRTPRPVEPPQATATLFLTGMLPRSAPLAWAGEPDPGTAIERFRLEILRGIIRCCRAGRRSGKV